MNKISKVKSEVYRKYKYDTKKIETETRKAVFVFDSYTTILVRNIKIFDTFIWQRFVGR